MLELTVYSRELCVQCQGVLRSLGNAVKKGVVDPADIKVVTVDGSPRNPKKVHDDIEVEPLVSEVEQDKARDFLRGLGHLQAPVVVLHRDGEIVYHNQGMRPGDIKMLVGLLSEQYGASEKVSALASA